jgi:hypothetical protein
MKRAKCDNECSKAVKIKNKNNNNKTRMLKRK